ncbi:Unr [Bugula neritina]|uniref:Unr n=1 Tax=Bugula neritina TaxID=10212 RepID=A0A7J7KE60_BUGNE|nr:Unr [Bugula neritina]
MAGMLLSYICLKENFGFIETVSLDEEVFFHYTCYDGNVGELTIGSLVEYHMACRGGSRMSAENVKLVPKSKGYIVSSL